MKQDTTDSRILLADCLVILIAALYAWLAYQGVTVFSAEGTVLDSDLQTYAQGMAREAFPQYFLQDAGLSSPSETNSIPNLQRWLATLLCKDGNFGLALLKAGAIALFIFYVNWYTLGRYLFKKPRLAALLALCSGVTIWVGWGTFWGVTHSDPVPRVFFGALMPILLLFAFASYSRLWLRPITMFLCGLSMWVHGISSLACGAMFMSAFFFCKAPGARWSHRLINLVLDLTAFLLPVGYFLWPTLTRKTNFTIADTELFKEVANIRWAEDFSNFWPRLWDAFQPDKPLFYLCVAGILCWLVLYLKRNPERLPLIKMLLAFLPGLAGVVLLVWLDAELANRFNRISVSHEVIRGLRFLIPIAWLAIIGAASIMFDKWAQRLILIVVFCLIAILNQDRQHLGVKTALADSFGLEIPKQAQSLINIAENNRKLFSEIEKIVPQGEEIFCPEDQMPLRYLAKRPLSYVFKDGYYFFYNKDLAGAKKWLAITKLLREPEGLLKAMRLSGASWFLLPLSSVKEIPQFQIEHKPVMEMERWQLYHIPQIKEADTQAHP